MQDHKLFPALPLSYLAKQTSLVSSERSTTLIFLQNIMTVTSCVRNCNANVLVSFAGSRTEAFDFTIIQSLTFSVWTDNISKPRN